MQPQGDSEALEEVVSAAAEEKVRVRCMLAAQVISSPSPFAGAGLFFVLVEHEGNQNAWTDEATRVAEIVRGLLAGPATWTDRHGALKAITLEDILIVAPYNAQVSARHAAGRSTAASSSCHRATGRSRSGMSFLSGSSRR